MVGTKWRNTLIAMRIACPLALFAAVAVGVFAWSHGLYLLAVVDAFLAGINLVLTCVQWFVFPLNLGVPNGSFRKD